MVAQAVWLRCEKSSVSSLILTSQMDRDKALSLLKEPSYDKATISNEIEFVANKLQISIEDLNSFLMLPHKSYKNYRNQAPILWQADYAVWG